MSTRSINTPRDDAPVQDRCGQPVSGGLNADSNWVGPSLSPERVAEEFTQEGENGEGTRPHVLPTQVPSCVGDVILENSDLSPLYQYRREAEQVTAWQIGDSSQALIRLDSPRRTIFMLPSLGETQRDLFWMLAHTIVRDGPFTITYLTKSTVTSILRTTRPFWRCGTEQLLYTHLDRSSDARINVANDC